MLDLERTIASRFPQWFSGARAKVAVPLVRGLARYSRLPQINEFLRRSAHLRGFAFVDAAMEFLDCRYRIDNIERERIPHSGRVVIVANHPMGAIDALALLKCVGDVRRDVRILANDVLAEVEGLRELILPLRILGGKPSADSLRAVDAALAAEQAVIVFPAGEVARISWRGVRDTRWRQGFLRFAESNDAPLLGVHIAGRNSALFYGLSAMYKPLGTALLAREMFARPRQRVEIRVTMPRPIRTLMDVAGNRQRALDIVRRALRDIGKGREPWTATQAPLAHPADVRAILSELRRCRLLGTTHDGKQIYVGRLSTDSPLLREIARLRELTFRAVGEGTGKRLDSDAYDGWYDQIVLWDAEACEIAGAYRVVPCARAMDERGAQGLYTASLFDYDARVLPVLERGMELGRSFVQPKYWGTRSLDYLWCGIGAYLRDQPQIRYLFGPVSISAELPLPAREWLVAYYSRYFGEQQTLAASKRPFRYLAQAPDFGALDVDMGLRILRDNLQSLGARIPTLYKQYTELCEPGGARFLAFGVDPDFADSVDGLILVDLARVKPKKRKLYLEAREGRALPSRSGLAVESGR